MIEFRPYPVVTARINRQGCMELFQGNVSSFYYDYNTPHAFIQSSDDVAHILESLPQDEQDELDRGWAVHTYSISDEYFTV